MSKIFTQDDQNAAAAEGWRLGQRDGVLEIQRIEGALKEHPLKDDWHCYAWCAVRAVQGSALHQRAVALHGTCASDETASQ